MTIWMIYCRDKYDLTEVEQLKHCQAFIDDCRQRAWGAACRADWIAKQLDKLVEDYGKLKGEDEKLLVEINALATAVNDHTKDNRDKRKALQERRNALAKKIEALGKNVSGGQRAANGLYQNIEASLQLVKHAETWEWKEVDQAEAK